eukprot:COSAG02_NODE_23064_length_731_cov_1.137658_1_plen_202_part_01
MQLGSTWTISSSQPRTFAEIASQDDTGTPLVYLTVCSAQHAQQAFTARRRDSRMLRTAQRAHQADMGLHLATRQSVSAHCALLEGTARKKLERAQALASHARATRTALVRAQRCEIAPATPATSILMGPRKTRMSFARAVLLGSIAAGLVWSVSWHALLARSGGTWLVRHALRCRSVSGVPWVDTVRGLAWVLQTSARNARG